MGTGQGSGTVSFLQTIAKPKTFYSESLQETVEKFQTALLVSRNVLLEVQRAVDLQMHSIHQIGYTVTISFAS